MQILTARTIEAKRHLQTKIVFWFLFGRSHGAPVRIRIISALRNKPTNRNQLSVELGVDYKLLQYHIEVLEKNNLVKKIGNHYGVAYCVSAFFENNEIVFDEIVNKLEKYALLKSKEMRM